MKAVIVTGSRHAGPEWNSIIAEQLTALPKGSTVIHGAAKGIDSLAGKIAWECGYQVLECPAAWDELGDRAGPIRNSAMLKDLLAFHLDGHEIEVLAFHNDIDRKGGTHDMVKKARAKNVKTTVFTLEGSQP